LINNIINIFIILFINWIHSFDFFLIIIIITITIFIFFQKQLEAKKELEKEVKKLKEEKQTAEVAVSTYRRAFENEMSKYKHEAFRHSLFKSRSTEDVQSLIEKNQQLQLLANELADTVTDREENIKHLKEVKHLLGIR
ncbi:hypothetical protein RFI_38608, partial [Reticulomyxa filosa]